MSNTIIASNQKQLSQNLVCKVVKYYYGKDTSKMFATRFVMIDKDVITNVSHNLDRTWYFWSEDRLYNPETALKQVEYSKLLQLDKTILKLKNMPLGYFAKRSSKMAPWVVYKVKYKD